MSVVPKVIHSHRHFKGKTAQGGKDGWMQIKEKPISKTPSGSPNF